VPQPERRPRVIVDYSFYGVNDDTLKLGPADAMQFGKVIKRLLDAAVRANPKFGPLRQYKVDISDCFYWITLSTSQASRNSGCLAGTSKGAPGSYW
jgi:hypothetical protein